MKPFLGITPLEGRYGIWDVHDQAEADRVARYLMSFSGITRISILPNPAMRMVEAETGQEKLVPSPFPLKVAWQPWFAFRRTEV